MKKVYVVEEEGCFNGGVEYENYKNAIKALEKDLCDHAHYNFQNNKNKIFTLSSAEVDDDDSYENWNTIVSMSVYDYSNLEYEEKEKIFDGGNNEN